MHCSELSFLEVDLVVAIWCWLLRKNGMSFAGIEDDAVNFVKAAKEIMNIFGGSHSCVSKAIQNQFVI
jgi:hypothetical protein